MDLINIVIGMVFIIIILFLGSFVFSKLTRFQDMEEIQKGNEAAGIYMGSKLLGLSIIVAMVSYSSHSWLAMAGWSLIGILALSLIYLVFDFLTPKFKVCDEIARGNKAVARLLSAVIIGSSIVLGTILM
ncbi:DUF350 domain-containing protein [Ammoniphilus sp. CFH 90114]|uniref:DUF350 domain-containing protein n=1 Tax=Ammoniphilus sp. CFH 90114 TaxID=2493665 RepID=UPI00100E942E|nr:DUF350 domain-containing protein [Ammoniphilus sp. CFH 90114]RXT08176.1 DUF350 domain-containing protein [Ammoniphilus sp. CFH 90114]